MGGTLVGDWVSFSRCSRGGCIVAQVILGCGVGFGVGAPVPAKMSGSCRMESMVWAPKGAKGAAGAGFARVSARRLAAYVAVLAENIAGMTPLLGGGAVLFWQYNIPMSPVCKCGSISSGVGPCRCTSLPCHGSPMCDAVAASCG